MEKLSKGWTRRDFLWSAASVALIGKAGLSLDCPSEPPSEANISAAKTSPATRPVPHEARVVLVRDKSVLDESGRPKPEIIGRMLDEGVSSLLGTEQPEAAWSSLVQPEDTVGIKSNEWRHLATPPEIEQILRERIIRAGVAEDRVAIDDRGALKNSVFGEATALINVRPMRTHHWAGVGGCIKNYIMFSPEPSSWHDDACADLAGLWNLPRVKGKTRLNILVMLTPLFHGKGPHHFQPRYLWDYRGLILGTDPVAVDATGLRILQAKRREYFGENQPLVVSPKHIRVAEEKFRLGVADPTRIQVIRLGWMDEALI